MKHWLNLHPVVQGVDKKKKWFSGSSEKSRKRKIEHLTKSDPAELEFSINIVLKNTGHSIAGKLIKF